ncbi:uncharacterized protein LOC121113484 isoform X2 [Gallus gallus]|uniref:uncharacterized protein LOC121113484 isoform X2 n=1 Tax=Gallus gallus TaxID=9031 RepID=UPI001F011DA7|nr:uncharacterized protein LOC121113484 isoform X2 [Gallus gallus]
MATEATNVNELCTVQISTSALSGQHLRYLYYKTRDAEVLLTLNDSPQEKVNVKRQAVGQQNSRPAQCRAEPLRDGKRSLLTEQRRNSGAPCSVEQKAEASLAWAGARRMLEHLCDGTAIAVLGSRTAASCARSSAAGPGGEAGRGRHGGRLLPLPRGREDPPARAGRAARAQPRARARRGAPLTIFVALLWTCSNSSTSFLCWGPQAWTPNG